MFLFESASARPDPFHQLGAERQGGSGLVKFRCELQSDCSTNQTERSRWAARARQQDGTGRGGGWQGVGVGGGGGGGGGAYPGRQADGGRTGPRKAEREKRDETKPMNAFYFSSLKNKKQTLCFDGNVRLPKAY